MKPEPKRRGRPPLDPDDPIVKVSLRVPAKRYETLCADAKRERITVSDWMRRLLARITHS